MFRERALKIVLVLVGLLFTAGIFLLIAVRNPSASQSDRLRTLVELRACGRHVRTRHEDAERAPRISRRLRRACRDWDNADFVGSKRSWRQTRVHGVVLRLIRSPSPTMISEAISSPTFSTHQIGARKYRCKRGFTNKLRGRLSRL